MGELIESEQISVRDVDEMTGAVLHSGIPIEVAPVAVWPGGFGTEAADLTNRT